MKVIFESESEVGQCDYEAAAPSSFRYADPDYAILIAHTQASLNGRSNLLRIEQFCYLRHGEDAPDQEWVAPKLLLEPSPSSPEEMIALAKEMHRQYVEEARARMPARLSV